MLRSIILFLIATSAFAQWSSGVGVTFPAIRSQSWGTTYNTTALSADGHRESICSVVQTPNYGAKSIKAVAFPFGAVTKSNGSTFRVSLQDPDTANGPVVRPDGTIDQSVTIANADANFATNTWYPGSDFNTTRSVTHGSQVCVVFDYGTFVAGDSVVIRTHSTSPVWGSLSGGVAICTTAPCAPSGTWAATQHTPLIVFIFSDNTYGTFATGLAASGVGALSINSTSTFDEYANVVTLSRTVKVDALHTMLSLGATSLVELTLYNSGGSVVSQCTINARYAYGSGNYYTNVCPVPVQTLSPGTYKVATKVTNTVTVGIPYYDVAVAGHQMANPGGTQIVTTSRKAGGTWEANNDTRYYLMGMRIVEDSTTGSGGTYTWVQ
jgi:hypothetical protein